MHRPRARFLAKAVAVTLLAGAIAAWPAGAAAGTPGLLAVALAVIVALAGTLLGRLPRLLIPDSVPDADVHRAMAGIGARLLVTAALALTVVLLDLAPRLPFAMVLVPTYLALLVLEVLDALASAQPAATASRPTEGALTR